MADSTLLDWIMSLLRDPEARADFQADPQGYAADNGLANLSAADVHDALTLIADNQSAGYDHRHGGDNGVHYPPPRHPDHNDGDGASYLNNYVTNNYTTIEDHSTNIDNSVHQNIDTDGGDFDQVIDNDPVVASGDGSVASGGDIRDSDITTGDGNVVGDGNQVVSGHGNTTAFGSGDATDASFEGARFGDGSAVSVGGNAYGNSEDNDTSTSVSNSGSGDTSVNAAGDHGYADQAADQSATDNSSFSNYEDNSSSYSDNEINSNNDSRSMDSHDTVVDHA
ncbi:IniB N-terminal domain-containing protein [Pseudonocardia acaciae]|uniref:IniB N-terminal domain-containing protein n=1 Tax=Pseudonocardia acaciae TaxID=551276 RepID=UPI00048B7BE5|nr:IniB N-terminal domain-containing protein [Pseudonocardia acaciae]